MVLSTDNSANNMTEASSTLAPTPSTLTLPAPHLPLHLHTCPYTFHTYPPSSTLAYHLHTCLYTSRLGPPPTTTTPPQLPTALHLSPTPGQLDILINSI
ncbi:hypothetical protein Hamer_G008964 [Homarus americanus]|uniref:Uncharacterized protein n=1 Tax=Homarus americanus TaxID=6706 RepID=A0A8J5MNW3_HOMAM|nr:hypothetical protein Hamer_G008964 [Homarus americanus]